MYSLIHLGEIEQVVVQAPDDGGRGEFQGAKLDEGKLLIVQRDGGGFIPETSHGAETWI